MSKTKRAEEGERERRREGGIERRIPYLNIVGMVLSRIAGVLRS